MYLYLCENRGLPLTKFSKKKLIFLFLFDVKAEENRMIIAKNSRFLVKMGPFLRIFAVRALNPTFARGKSLVGRNESLPNVLGREYDSNHTIFSTQKGRLGSEKYFFALF